MIQSQLKWLVRTYGYSRTSDKKNPVDSILGQQRMIEKYARRNGLQIIEHLSDEMKSGTNQDREGFQKQFNLVEQNLVDVIIVAYFDRLGRNSIQISTFLMKLKQKGIECVSVGQNKKLSLMGERDIVQEAIYADVENRNRRDRLHSSKKDSLKSGEYAHTFAPIGYDKTNERKLIPNAAANYVQFVFRKYIKYGSVNDVVKKIKEHASYKTMNPSIMSIQRILSNKTYLGNLYMRETSPEGAINQKLYAKNSHQSIIDEETFQKVQNLLQINTRKYKARNFHLFSGVLVCSKCNKNMIGAGDKYTCIARGCKTSCLKKHIEPQLLHLLSNISKEEESLKEKYEKEIRNIEEQQRITEIEYATLKINKARLKEKLFQLDVLMKEAYDAYMREAFKLGSYKDLIEKKQYKELWEVMINRNLKIKMSKVNYKTFELTVQE